MDFLKQSRRTSVISESLYVLLNIILAVAVVVIIITTESLWLALGVVLLSKWRIFAVRPHYWVANILSNFVDIIVSVGIAILLYNAQEFAPASQSALPAQVVLTLLYVGWLLFIKPRSNRTAMAIQAGAAIFFGSFAVFTIGYDWPSSVVVAVMWIIGYTAARHVLSAYKEPHFAVLSLVVGFMIAEMSWLLYHWTIGYQIPGGAGIKLPQASIVLTLVTLTMERVYDSYHTGDGELRFTDIAAPVVFSGAIIMVLVVLFGATLGL